MKMEVGLGRQSWVKFWWAVGTLLLLMIFKPICSFCPPLCSCDDSTLFTDCHEARNLKMVPIFLNPQTKFLSLSQNQIKEISMSLQFYSELQLLDFSQNQIESLGGNNFENLRNLKVLNVSYNSIRVLESSAFSGLSQAVVLDLSVNQIERIDPVTFKGLVGLRDLSLDRNRLESLDWDLFSDLQSLERLTLRYNFIRILQPPLSFRPFLTTNNSNNEINESEKLLPLPLVQPPWTLRQVLEVDLSWNQLAAVRNFGLAPLLPSLRSILLCCNYIHTLEEYAFSTFSSGSNYPGNNSSQVLKFTSGLTSVNLSQNLLTAVPSEALSQLSSSLVDLDLSSNGITDNLPAGAFRLLFHLRRLRISANPAIHSIDPTALLDNVQLVTVEANHLNLTGFPLGLLDNKPHLERFSFQFSQIQTFPPGLFINPTYSAQMDKLDFFGNPINCNCSVWKLYEHVVKVERGELVVIDETPTAARHYRYPDPDQKVSLGNIRCSSPPNLQATEIRALSPSDFEHCFEPPPFSQDYFELLVILLATLIVFLILTAVGIKICCVYRVCPHQKRRKATDLDSKKEGTTLDEFCSNIVIGHGGCESGSVTTSCASGEKFLGNGVCRDFTPPIPPSPALSSRSKSKTACLLLRTLPTNSNGPFCGNGQVPLSYHRSPRTTTLGGSRLPCNYDDDEERYHQYMTINTHQKPSPATLARTNKLRFNPKMQLVLDNDPGDRSGGQRPPPMISYYDEYPEYRHNHPGPQRYKQVPSVLV